MCHWAISVFFQRRHWIPAFAGITVRDVTSSVRQPLAKTETIQQGCFGLPKENALLFKKQ
jgi:hypothetical protein